MHTPEGTVPLDELVLAQDKQLLIPTRPVHRLNEQQRVCHAKLDVLREAGMEPYPVDVPYTMSVDDAAAQSTDDVVSLSSRVRALRDLGGVVFAVIEEHDQRVQVVLEREEREPAAMRLWHRTVDVGDHISVTGTLGRSRNGEPSPRATSWCMASKALRPIPSDHTGSTNSEARLRQRYLNLIVNKESAALLRARSRGVFAIRQAFIERGYMEVETRCCRPCTVGRAPGRSAPTSTPTTPISTCASRLNCSSRTSRVGGMERIFELNRNFRNEGADATHNPELTSVEAYAAHGDYTTM